MRNCRTPRAGIVKLHTMGGTVPRDSKRTLRYLLPTNGWTTVLPLSLALGTVCCGDGVPSAPRVGDILTGKLQPELVAQLDPLSLASLADMDPREAERYGLHPKASATLISDVWNVAGHSLRVAVERSGDQAALYADIDESGRFDDGERFPFEKDLEDEFVQAWASFSVPAQLGPFRSFPVAVALVPTTPNYPPSVHRSSAASVAAVVDIAGRPTLFNYPAPTRDGDGVDWRNGPIAVDGDGDGAIAVSSISPERADAHQEDVVFRVGETFVSTESVNFETMSVTVRVRAKSDCRRIEIREDSPVPDFEFVDFDGNPRRLSVFEGQYVLLDFWGTWCGPCVRQFPHLKEVYDEFHSRGFEILGMDVDPSDSAAASKEEFDLGLERARTVVRKHSLPWPQARTESIRDTVNRGFRILGYPTLLLVSPDRRLVHFDEVSRGHGAELPYLLDRILDKSASQPVDRRSAGLAHVLPRAAIDQHRGAVHTVFEQPGTGRRLP